MSKHDFDPVRLKKNLTRVADYIHGTPHEAFDKQKVLDEIATDIEDLHRKAQERDNILASIMEITYDHYIDRDELLRLHDCYTDEKGDLTITQDLSL